MLPDAAPKIKSRCKCIVPGCKGNITHKSQRLPHPRKDPKKFIAWINACNRTDLFDGDILRVYYFKRICRMHFSPGCFYQNYDKLRPDAVPDIHLPGASEPVMDSRTKGDVVSCPQMGVEDLLALLNKNTSLSVTGHAEPVVDSRTKRDGASCPQMRVEDLLALLDQNTPLSVTGTPVEDSRTRLESSFPEETAETSKSVLSGKQIVSDPDYPKNVVGSFGSNAHSSTCVETILTSETLPTETCKEKSAKTIKAFKTHNIKVLGNSKNLHNPSLISDILSQAKLKKKGTVYILPVKDKIDSENLTSSKLEEIVTENTTGINKKRLLNVLRGIETGRRRRKIGYRTNKKSYKIREKKLKRPSSPKKKRKPNRTGLKRTCNCDIHCKKTVISAGISTKIDGTFLNGDSDLFNPSELDNVFTLSTILTNVNDRYQIEQLCQLLIESVFRLKNINISGSMGTLMVYLTHNAVNKPGQAIIANEGSIQQEEQVVSNLSLSEEIECSFAPETINGLTNQQNENSFLFDIQKTNLCLPTQMKKPDVTVREIPHFSDQSILKHKNVKLNLTAFHDHNYLSLESKILFEKPKFLVNLINVDTFKSSRKKSRILIPNKKVTTAKKQVNTQKFQKRLNVLREKMERKTAYINLLQNRNKFLKNIILTETSHQRLKYPKGFNTNERIIKENVQETSLTAVGNLHFDTETGQFEHKTTKFKHIQNSALSKSTKKTKSNNSNNRLEGNSIQKINPIKRKKRRLKSSDAQNFDLSMILGPEIIPNYRRQLTSDQEQDELMKYKTLFESLIQQDVGEVLCEELLLE